MIGAAAALHRSSRQRVQLTDNKPIGRLRHPVPRQATAQVSRLHGPGMETAIAYVDASVKNGMMHTAHTCAKLSKMCQTCSYAANPVPLAYPPELAAIHHGMAAILPNVEDIGFVEEQGKLYCEHCYESYMAPICRKCGHRIKGICQKNLEGQSFFAKGGRPFCKAHAR
ncbi:hypothetical protein HPB48_000473 [Haemaphysalis longicornis]|uniref:Uncharacterized protein n=1 Tax=Haemaphysalis longicornis TaxID=44386 RepID=A0A9J6FPL8_HAELO|nr:hypothetical protein HPB48_000473 [Haemaphysalis longicornis]